MWWWGGHSWQGVCMALEGMHSGGPPGHYEIRSVNARAVRILLECILVVIDISLVKVYYNAGIMKGFRNCVFSFTYSKRNDYDQS